jgi:hypothetical protein
MKLLDCFFFVSISQLIPRMNSFKRKACISVFTQDDQCFFFNVNRLASLLDRQLFSIYQGNSNQSQDLMT